MTQSHQPPSHPPFTPITTLTTSTKEWTIRGMCIGKNPLKYTSKGTPMLSFRLKDESGEIEIGASGGQAEQLFELVQPSQWYAITAGTVRAVLPRYKPINPYAIRLNEQSQVWHLPLTIDDEPSPPPTQYPTLNDIADLSDGTVPCAVIAVIKGSGVCQSICMHEDGLWISKREVHLIDDSQCSIRLILWAHLADEYDASCVNSIITVTNVMLYTHKEGRILSTTPESSITLNDARDARAKELQHWYDAIKRFIEFKELSPSPLPQACAVCKQKASATITKSCTKCEKRKRNAPPHETLAPNTR
jgi:hypothetical protein